MKAAILSSLALASGSHALVARGDTCCFGLTASGGPGGKLGQLGDGQNRIGDGSLPVGKYCISNGAITDAKGRGCILTPPTTQLQCDVGAKPTGGFAVGCDGTLTHNGDSTFYACPTGDNGGFNIYTEPVKNQDKCVKTTLTADGCKAKCPSKPPPSSGDGCPADLTGSWEFPHLIIPVDYNNKDKSPGQSSYNGVFEHGVSSIFNFDIPQSDAGKTCTLEFLFPKQSQLQTSSYTFTGSGKVKVSALNHPATTGSSYSSTVGDVKQIVGEFDFTPGSKTTIAKYPCPAGQRVGVWIEPMDDTCLTYFQDYNPCPIGLYIQTS